LRVERFAETEGALALPRSHRTAAHEDFPMARRPHHPYPKTRVFLVDDEPLVRRGLRLLLGLEADLEVCGEAEGEQSALDGILKLQPRLAVVDLSLAQGNGLELIRKLHQLCPSLKLLVFSMHDRADVAAAAFSAGAHGYLIKEESGDLVCAIRAIMDGGYFLSPQLPANTPGLGIRK